MPTTLSPGASRPAVTVLAAAAMAFMLTVQPATATLIGGSARATLGTDTGGGFNESDMNIVDPILAGNGDLTMIGGTAQFPHNIDFEAFSFTITIASTGWSGPPTFLFNGYRIDQFDWQGVDQVITGVSVIDNHPTFGPGNVSFTDTEVFVDFKGLSTNGTEIEITLQTQDVPEPATALLVGAGALAMIRRQAFGDVAIR